MRETPIHPDATYLVALPPDVTLEAPATSVSEEEEASMEVFTTEDEMAFLRRMYYQDQRIAGALANIVLNEQRRYDGNIDDARIRALCMRILDPMIGTP